MQLISKQEVLSHINKEISKCPNHHVLKILERLKNNIELMMVNIPPRKDITVFGNKGLCDNIQNQINEYEQFKKQFKQ